MSKDINKLYNFMVLKNDEPFIIMINEELDYIIGYIRILCNKNDYKLIFKECFFYESDIKRLLSLTSNLHFIKCKMKNNYFISIETFYKITQYDIKINNSIILIELSKINKSDFILFFSRLDFFKKEYGLKEVKITLDGLTGLILPTSLKKLHINKLSIGCKAMTLKKWHTFFNYEEYVFRNERKSKEFINMRENFNKFYNCLRYLV